MSKKGRELEEKRKMDWKILPLDSPLKYPLTLEAPIPQPETSLTGHKNNVLTCPHDLSFIFMATYVLLPVS